MRAPILVLPLAALAVTTGCGNERAGVPPLPPPSRPEASRPVVFLDRGVSMFVPRNWRVRRGTPPLVATVSSGRATVAVWRHPRAEPLPTSPSQLQRARRALIAAVRSRDRTLTVGPSRLVRIGGVPGVELVVTQRIAGQPRRVRSIHLYGFGVELVVDAQAAPPDFLRVDRQVFGPLIASVRLARPVAG